MVKCGVCEIRLTEAAENHGFGHKSYQNLCRTCNEHIGTAMAEAANQINPKIGKQRRITHVAIRYEGKIWSLPAPYRHHNILQVILFLRDNTGTVDAYGPDQGFLDDTGQYWTREDALEVAVAARQLLPRAQGVVLGKLFSEDIW